MKVRTIIASLFILLLVGCQSTQPNNKVSESTPVTQVKKVEESQFVDKPISLFHEDYNVRVFSSLEYGYYNFDFYSKSTTFSLECTMAYYSSAPVEGYPNGIHFPDALNLLKNTPRKVLVNNVGVKDVSSTTLMKAQKVYIANNKEFNVKGATFYLQPQNLDSKVGVRVNFKAQSGLTKHGYNCIIYDSVKKYAEDSKGRKDLSKQYQYQKGIRYTYYFNKTSKAKVCKVIDKGVVIRKGIDVAANSWSEGIPKEKGYAELSCRNKY